MVLPSGAPCPTAAAVVQKIAVMILLGDELSRLRAIVAHARELRTARDGMAFMCFIEHYAPEKKSARWNTSPPQACIIEFL